MPRALARGLLVVGSLLATALILALAELVLGWLDLPSATRGESVRFDGLQPRTSVVSADPDLLFRFAPHADFLGYYRTNALGYRGVGAPRARDEVALRVVTLGDSCTFGLGVPEDAVFSGLLEHALRTALEGVGEVDVVSMGIPGYSSWQNRRQLEIGLEGLRPDVVVWMPTGYNDAIASGGASDPDRGAAAHSWAGRWARLRLVQLVTGPPEVELEREQIGLAALHEGASPRVPPGSFVEQLERGAAAARELGARLILVRPALGPGLLGLDPSLAERERAVAATAARLGLSLVDARRTFDVVAGLPLTSDGLHPNEAGHAALAAAVFEALVGAGCVADRPRERFLEAFLDACSAGVGAAPTALRDQRAWPPALERRSAAAAEGELGAAPPAVSAWLESFAAAEVGDGERAARAKERAEEVEARVRPPSLLRSLLWGDSAPTPVPASAVARARALAAFGRELGLRPVRVDRAYVEALAAVRAGDAGVAEARFREALRLDPDRTETRHAFVRFLQRAGRPRDADAQTAVLLERDPDSAAAREIAGLRALAAERFDEAVTHLEAARTLDPVAPWTLYGLGRAYLARERFAEAEVVLRTARMLAGRTFPDIDELHARAERGLRGG